MVYSLSLLKGQKRQTLVGFPPTSLLGGPTASVLALESCTWSVCNLYRPQPDLCFCPFVLFPHFSVLHAVDLQHVGEGRVAGEGFDGGGGKVRLEGVHAGGDEGEVFGAEVVGLDAATELLVLPVHLGAEVFDFYLSHALHFREDFFARGGHWFQVSGFKFQVSVETEEAQDVLQLVDVGELGTSDGAHGLAVDVDIPVAVAVQIAHVVL